MGVPIQGINSLLGLCGLSVKKLVIMEDPIIASFNFADYLYGIRLTTFLA